MSTLAQASPAGSRLESRNLILLTLAGGFLLSLIEVRYVHRGVVAEHAVAWIPTVASLLGIVACLLALAAGRVSRLIASVLLGGIAVAGLVGLYQHTELKPAAFTALFASGPKTVAAGEAEEGYEQFEQEAETEATPPALAPLSLSGLALIGFLAASPRKRRSNDP